MNNLNQLLSIWQTLIYDNKGDSEQSRFIQNRVLEVLYSSEDDSLLPEIFWVFGNDLKFVDRVFDILELKKQDNNF